MGSWTVTVIPWAAANIGWRLGYTTFCSRMRPLALRTMIRSGSSYLYAPNNRGSQIPKILNNSDQYNSTYCMPGTVLGGFYILSHFIFTAALWVKSMSIILLSTISKLKGFFISLSSRLIWQPNLAWTVTGLFRSLIYPTQYNNHTFCCRNISVFMP